MGIIIRQTIKASAAHYVGIGIGMITTLFLVPWLLPPETYGLTQVIYEAALLISVLAQLGTSSSIIRFFPYFKSKDGRNNGFFFYIMLMPTIGLAVFIPLYYLLRGPISDLFISKSELFVQFFDWVAPLAIFLAFWTVLETYANVQMRIVVPRIIREVGIRVMIVAAYFLYYFGYLTLPTFVLCCIAPYGVAMILTFLYVKRISSVSLKHDFSYIDKPLRKKITNYTLFLVIAALSGNLLKQLDTFMIGSIKGLYDTGIYKVLLYVAIIVEIPMRSITAISNPIAANALKNDDFATANDLYKKVSLHQLLLGGFIFVMIWINVENIFAIIPNGENYAPHKWVIFFIGMERLIHVTLNFGSTLISFSRFYYWELFFAFFIVAIGIATNIILIPKIGIVGAAVATLITTTIVYCVRQWIVLIKIKGNPYTINTFKTILLVAAMFGLDYLLPNWSHNAFIDAAYRSIIIGGLMIFIIYKGNFSEIASRIADKSWEKFCKIIKKK